MFIRHDTYASNNCKIVQCYRKRENYLSFSIVSYVEIMLSINKSMIFWMGYFVLCIKSNK